MMASKPTPKSGDVIGAFIAGQTASGHSLFVGLAFELIGISVLAVFADMNDDLGQLMVVVMIGWFIVFLSINAEFLQKIVPGAKAGSASVGQYATGLSNQAAQTLG